MVNYQSFMSPEEYQASILVCPHVSDLAQVKFLLENGISINIQDVNGNYLIHIAIQANYPELMCFLLESGANPNVRNHAGETPMMLAVQKGCSGLLDLLFNHSARADLNDVFIMSSYLLQNARHQ